LARNKELNQKMKDERREQILSNALMLFATKGLSATKIIDISGAARISQGLMYHYYKSKEEMFIELIKYALERMNAACIELEKIPMLPHKKIEMAIEKLLQGFDNDKNTSYYYLLILHATVSEAIPDEAKEIIRQGSSLPYEVVERILIEGQKDGSIRDYDAKDLAVIFWASIKGLALNKAAFGEGYKMPDTRILMNVFLKE